VGVGQHLLSPTSMTQTPSIPSPGVNSTVNLSTSEGSQAKKRDVYKVFVGNLPEPSSMQTILEGLTALNSENKDVTMSLKLNTKFNTISCIADFTSKERAEEAIAKLDGTNFCGSTYAKVSWSLSPEELAMNSASNIHMSDIPQDYTEEAILALLKKHGVYTDADESSKISIKLPRKADGTIRGYAYCSFANGDQARKCLTLFSADGELANHKIQCSPFKPKWQRKMNFTNVVVLNLPMDVTKEQLITFFKPYVVKSLLIKQNSKKIMTYAFVDFNSHHEAVASCQLTGTKVSKNLQPYVEGQDGKCYVMDIQKYKDQSERGAKADAVFNKNTITAQDWQMIGDNLYRAVLQIYPGSPHLAAKITGMVMELDYQDLVTLLKNDGLFQQKVNEAVLVLKDVGLYEHLR